MTDRRDYIALEWVSGEITESLGQCELLLKDVLHTGGDVPLERAAAILHQVQGSLHMIEFSGPALLLAEMEAALVSVRDGSASHSPIETVQAVLLSAQEFPPYLQDIANFQRELPATLIGIVNNLRAALGQNLLSASPLFNPRLLDEVDDSESHQQLPDNTFLELASKLLKMYQIAVAAYIRGGDDQQNLVYLGKVCGRTAKLCSGKEQKYLWLAALALIEGLANKSIAKCFAVQEILARLELELSAFAQQGAVASDRKVATALLKDVLFYVASSTATSRYIAEAFERHKLHGLFNDGRGEGDAPAALAAELRGTLAEELQDIAKQLSTGGNNDLSQRCKLVGDALAVLGVVDAKHALAAIQDKLESGLIAGGSHELIDSLRQLAASLLNSPAADTTQQAADMPGHESADLAAVAKGRAVLFEAQEAIIAYVAEHWQCSYLQGVPEQLRQSATALIAVDFADSAAIFESCAEYIDHEIIATNREPEWQMLDALADALTAVDYYLERSAKGRENADQGLLAAAQIGVARLGYPVAGEAIEPSATVLSWPESSRPVTAHGEGEAEGASADEAVVDIDPEILDIFLEEAEEVLEKIQETMPPWRENVDSGEHLATVRRAFHTLKGSGRMVGAEQLAELAWSVEAMLNKVVDGRLRMDEARLYLIDRIVDCLPEMIAGLRLGQEISSTTVNAFTSRAKVLTEQQLPAPATDPNGNTVDDALIAIFIAEANAHLQVLETYIDGVDSYPATLTDDVQRALHTLKGSSNMAEVGPISEIITPLEGLVKELRSMRVAAEERLIALIGDVVSEVRSTISDMASMPVSELSTASELVHRINSLAVQLIHEAEFSADRDSRGELAPGALDAFLAGNSDSIQGLGDLISEPADLTATQLIEYAPIMGVFAQRAEDINCEAVAELAHALQVLLGHARNPLGRKFIALVDQALEQLMQYLNELAGEQEVNENAALLDTIRDFDGAAELDSDSVPPTATSVVSPSEVTPQVSTENEVDPEIVEIFMEEAHELLEQIDEAIHHFSEDQGDQNRLYDIQRYLHTLKGGARMSGMTALGDASHDFETAIATALTNSASNSEAFLAAVQGFQDQLVRQVTGVDGGQVAAAPELTEADSVDTEQLDTSLRESPPPKRTEEADELSDNEVLGQVAELLPSNVTGRMSPQFDKDAGKGLVGSAARAPQEMIKVPSALLERLINLAGETSIARGRIEEQVSEIHYSLEEMEITVERLQEQVRRLDIETEAQIVFRQEQVESEGADGFDPLEFDRYSQLQQLSRSLLESASDLTDLRGTLVEKSRDMETLLSQQSRVNTELQEGLMRSQMVNFSRMVPRLRRGVRQVASELDKAIDFNVYNAEGEMDRRVLERIIPALEHMLRNAVDHGIESPAKRLAAGKRELGEITMRFDRQGGDVVIVISDDGGGIDLSAVRSKAEKLGLVNATAELSERQILEYIFHAGFSTASNVTQISGRGVGMDVVRSEIKQLGGAIEIDTTLGQGSRFEIRLPFTVSVNRALMVSVGGEIFAVPLNNIEGIVRVSPYELDIYYQEDGPDFEYAGQEYKLRYLGHLLGASRASHLQGQTEPRPVLLIRNADPPTAVQVDSLMGSREVVVKTLGPQFAAVPGLSGATVLGDGSVVVILDMLASIRADNARQLLADKTEATPIEYIAKKLVMVVDDSVTVRKVTSRLLARQQMDVSLARDGVDAVNQLQVTERLPDVILLDIEMPRMDGFEVVSRVRSNPRLKDIPIIMISSRTGQKHRQRAFSLGVHNFLGKPYQEMQLLKAIEEATSAVAGV